MICGIILETVTPDITHRPGSSSRCLPADPFILASSDICGTMLSAALHLAAAPTILRLLRPLLLTIASEQAWFEIDPDHTEEGEVVEANIGNLERACQWFLDTILVSLKDIPHSCRLLLAAAASCFADQGLKVMCQAASLCFFCQLVVPCILSPLDTASSSSATLDNQITLTARSRRALVYIAEAIRAVASNAPFDANTPGRSKCMTVVNSFITRNAPKTLVSFESVILSPNPSTPRASALSEGSCKVLENDDVLVVSAVLVKRRAFIQSWLAAQGVEEDIALLKELSEGFQEAADTVVDAATAFAQPQHESIFPELLTSRSSSPEQPPSASAATQSSSLHFLDAASHCNDHHDPETAQELLANSSLSHAGSDVCSNEGSVISSLSASVAASAAAAALSSAAVVAAIASDSVFGDNDSNYMAGMTSVEQSSLSPVSFLIQSHTGLLPPTSPLSRTPQTTARAFQQDSSFDAARGVVLQGLASRAVGNQANLGSCSRDPSFDVETQQRSEAEELEILLQRQLLSEQLQHQQQLQSQLQHQFVASHVKVPSSHEQHLPRAYDQGHSHPQQLDLDGRHSETDHHHHAPQQLHLQDQLPNNRILRIPLSPSLTPPTIPESNAAFPEVIKPYATRLPSRLYGSPEELPLDNMLLQRQFTPTSASGELINPSPPQHARYVSAAPASFAQPPASHSTQPVAGIGLTLKRNSKSNLCVRRVSKGGPSDGALLQRAECSRALLRLFAAGTVAPGDVLVSVDGQSAAGLGVSQVCGPERRGMVFAFTLCCSYTACCSGLYSAVSLLYFAKHPLLRNRQVLNTARQSREGPLKALP
jgi:hypothetical protein